MKNENIITEKVETGFTKDIEFWINLLEKPFDKSVFLYDFFPVKALKYDSYHFQINKDLTNKLLNICSNIDSKLFGLLTSSLIGLLNKYTSNEDIVIAIPIYKQSTEGSYNNTFLPLRINVNANFDYKKLVFQVVNNINEVITHQNFPLKKVSKLISQDDLFSSIDVKILSHDIHDVSNIDSDFQSNFNLLYEKKDECIDCEIRYNASLYKSDTIKRIANHFVHFTEKCIAKSTVPFQEISLLSESEENRLLYEFNNTKSDYPRKENIISLFEEQVNKNSDRIALVFNEKQISYKFLNQRANKLAHYLRNEGIKEGNSVALMIERSLEMIIGIIAILKTGGKYLPIDTSQPESRIKNILHDSKTNIILIKQNFEGLSDDIFNIIDINDEEINKCNDKNLNIQISSDSIAYTIYTSGSTGKPKGVMISHTPVINLVYSETDEFELDKEEKILQFSPIFFDPSVEQMWLALFNGATLILISKEKLLEQHLFNNYILKHKVTHFPVTPSYLESIELNNTNSIKRIVAGGETCNMQLAHRYCNDYNFYNVYGPTETTVNSIECLVTADMIDGSRLPIGKPIKNTSIYILGQNLELLPIGVKGELWIGGDGLSKGYNNDFQLTNERFLDNPFVQGEKIYRTGDFARWLPDGNIDFLGRIDNQLKIRGFRIELGEIESQISTHDNIEKAVVLAKEDAGDKYLVAYYVSEKEIGVEDLRDHLSHRIPDYMIPSYFVHMKSLPLNSNGKLDTKALPDEKIKAGKVYIAPETKEEKILADVWSKVLGIDKISITDNFFSVGGDSIKSIQISSRMRSKGYGVTVNDIFTNQTIKDLSKKLKKAEIESDQELITGKSLPTPIQQLFFETDNTDSNHFNQSVILHFTEGVSERTIRMIFEKLQTHHDALRIVCKQEGSETILQNMGGDFPLSLEEFDLKKESNPEIVISSKCSVIQSSIDLENGPLIKLGLFHTNDGSHLLIVIHHLVIDGVSWRIIFEDIESLYQQVISNEPLSLPFKTDPFLSWSEKLSEYSRSKSFEESKPYWNNVLSKKAFPINRDYPNEDNIIKDCKMKSFQLNKEETKKLLTEVHSSFNTKINDILLAALYLSIKKLYACKNVMLDLESHGREQINQNIDITRTLGWFTSFFPVIIESDENNLAIIIKHVKENLRRVPNNGIDFLLLNNMNRSSSNKNAFDYHESQISFNYLGQFDADLASKTFLISDINKGNDISPNNTRNYDWDISGIIKGKQLELSLTYSIKQYKDETIISFMDSYKESLKEVINFCSSYGRVELTPSDLTYKDLSIRKLDELQNKYEIEDIYPLSPMQEGMLFHSLVDVNSEAYFEQVIFQMNGNLDLEIMEKSFGYLIRRHGILRTIFLHEDFDRPMQIVLKNREIDFRYENISKECLSNPKEDLILKYCKNDKSKAFDLKNDALIRLLLIQTATNEFEFIFSFHHILMDGWCMSILLDELITIYLSNINKQEITLPYVKEYSHYISWLEKRNKEEPLVFWEKKLSGYSTLASIPNKEKASLNQLPWELGSEQLLLNKRHTNLLIDITKKYNVTLNTILQCIWGILLGRYNNVEEIVFGSVVSGRPSNLEDVEQMIGLFINTIPVRVIIQPDDEIGNLLQRAQNNSIECEPYHYCSLTEIQEVSELGRSLFDHIMVFENYPIRQEVEGLGININEQESLSISNVQTFEQTNYDFAILIVPGEEVQIRFDYNSNLYKKETVQKISCHLQRIVEQIISNNQIQVSDIEIVTKEERQIILEKFNNTEINYPIKNSLIDLFEKQAQKIPNATSIVFGQETLSYEQLNNKANAIASRINDKVERGKNHKICLLFNPSLEMIISILGILKAGCVYTPLSPDVPEKRNEYIFSDCNAQALLVQESIFNENPKTCSFIDQQKLIIVKENAQLLEKTENYQNKISQDDPIYVIYTSGTTGSPKGVEIKNTGIVNMLNFYKEFYNVKHGIKMSQFANICFDASAFEIWPSLIHGGCLYIAPNQIRLDPSNIGEWLMENEIEITYQPTVIAELLLQETGWEKDSFLRVMNVAGDRFNFLPNKETPFRVYNLYGPTEDSIWTTWAEIKFGNTALNYSIGKPIANKKIYIIDKTDNLQPIGVPGELCISGKGLANGYVNSEKLTKEKFIKNPFDSGERMYKTGDSAQWLPNGEIEFLGRIDSQVKVRGFRIELGEIENLLSKHESLKDIAVIDIKKEDNIFLAAYFTSDDKIETSTLKKYLEENLPNYMIPSYFVQLEKLPLTLNGKIDRKNLPAAEININENFVAASTNIEVNLTKIWSGVLGIDQNKIGINNNFFEIGGNSINIIKLNNKINTEFNCNISVANMFRLPTITSIQDFILNGDLDIRKMTDRIDEGMDEAHEALKIIDSN